MSVPDSDMLISISEVLETPVSTLLGETVPEAEVDNLKAISEKLEVINLQLGTKESHEKENYSLAAYFIMCNYSNDFCSFNNME